MKPENKCLTSHQVGGLIKMLDGTHDIEMDCSECLQHVGEFAERRLAGQPLNELIARVEQHLDLCPECREDYLALLKILEAGQ